MLVMPFVDFAYTRTDSNFLARALRFFYILSLLLVYEKS